jgi:hypothetical protein
MRAHGTATLRYARLGATMRPIIQGGTAAAGQVNGMLLVVICCRHHASPSGNMLSPQCHQSVLAAEHPFTATKRAGSLFSGLPCYMLRLTSTITESLPFPLEPAVVYLKLHG